MITNADALRADAAVVIRRARALVFDFDGTLVDSNAIKWRGFEEVFAEFQDRLDDIMVYCRGANHRIRGDKFRHVYEQILGLPYTAAIESELQGRYAAATTQAIIDAREIPGAMAFLTDVGDRYRTALLSSTPHHILLEILERRGMRRYFQHVQGAPVDKAAWLRAFRRDHALASEQIAFFGDTKEDMIAATASGCVFIGVGQGVPFPDACAMIADFQRLSR